MARNVINTGEVTPRGYGVSFPIGGGNKAFLSPMRYVLGQIMLEGSKSLESRISRIGEIYGFNDSELNRIRTGFGDDDLSHLDTVLGNVRRYGGVITGDVDSKSGDGSYGASLFFTSKGSFESSNCGCSDSYWGNNKRKGVVCSHVAALNQGIYLDNVSKKSMGNNHTGLSPSQRPNVKVPFNNLVSEDRFIDDLLVKYFISNEKMYDIERELLLDSSFLSPSLVSRINGSNNHFFEVLTQGKKRKSIKNLSSTQEKFYGAVNSVISRTNSLLQDFGYQRSGTGVEFQETDHEMIGTRFRNGDTIYSIAVSEDSQIPLLIKKSLGKRTKNLYDSTDSRFDEPILRVGSGVYTSIDDYSRRDSAVQVMLPWESDLGSVSAAGILKDRYESLK